ncbi:hypothetical protein CC78DRAFT_463345, partial [Lojkania enalia]
KIIRVINDWPNPDSAVATSDKVPSKISYKDGQPHHWGFEVNFKEESFRWIKLLLDPMNKFGHDSEAALNTQKLLRTLGKTAEVVATDLLRFIWRYTKEDIGKVRGDDWESVYTLSVVLTVPAIWPLKEKDRTLRIAREAGLPDNLKLVSEPEAAALSVLKERSDEGASLEVGDCFVVCDAGGGTVDLISYKICGLNPLQIEECALGDGELCGSVYLDQAFERYIKTIVGDQWNMIKEKAKKKMMDEFELSIKRCYTGEDQIYSVDLYGVEDNPKEGIDDETILLKPYGLCYEAKFDKMQGHIDEDRDWSPRGYWQARNQMKWLLEKGSLYYCADDDPPSRKETSVKELCRVNYGIKSSKLWFWQDSYKDPKDGEKWRIVPFNLYVEFGSATLQFSVFYRDEPVAYTEAKYKEDLIG